ncbi:MAG: tetratricopeptide repeat protein [Candidatus Margulisiibacteriota bacterium]
MEFQIEDIKKALKKNPRDPYAHKDMGGYFLLKGSYKEAVKEYKIASSLSPRVFADIVNSFEYTIQKDLDNVPVRLGLVEFYLGIGELEDAVIELEELVEIAPEMAVIYNLLGKIYLKLGRIDGAIDLLEKAMQAGKGEASLLESLASAYIERERYAEAIGLYEELLKNAPSSKQVLRTLTELYKRVNDPGKAAGLVSKMAGDDPEVLIEACEKLEAIVKESPQSPQARLKLADIYFRIMKLEPAVEQLCQTLKLDASSNEEVILLLRKALPTYPENRYIMLQLAKCLVVKGSYSEAAELYTRIFKSDPSMADTCVEGHLSIIFQYPDQAMSHKSLAEAYLYKLQTEKALEEYAIVVRLDPEEIEEIEKKCREILKQDPGMLKALLVLSQSYLSGGELRKAIAIAEEYLEKAKPSARAYLILGEAYFKLNIYNRSCESYKAALKLSPNDESVMRRYRAASEKETDLEISLVKAKVEQDSWRVALNIDLAKVLLKRRNYEAAIRHLQSSLKDSTRSHTAHRIMGQIFKEQGNFDMAKVQFEKSLESKNVDDQELINESRASLGSAYEAMGDVQKALSCYEAVTASNIDFGDLSKRIKTLNQANPLACRNKSAAVVFSLEGMENPVAVWGRDIRKSRSGDEDDLTSMSFGQDQNSKGFTQMLKGRLKAAEAEFLLASQLDAKLIPALNNIAAINLISGELEAGLPRLLEAVGQDGGNPSYRNNLGAYYLLKGDVDAAEKEFKAGLKNDKDFSPANLNLGDLEMKRKNIEEGIAHYKKIGRFDPLYEISSRRLQFWAV